MTANHDVTNETHRASCAECRALWAELDAISAEAARLPLLSPSRDLWAGIEARIAPAARPAPRRWFQHRTLRLATAASLLIAATATVTWQLAAGRGEAPTVAALPTASDTPEGLHLAALGESVSQMDREIAALETLVRDRNNGLDSVTVQVLETNLRVIDAAIAESRAALAADPASQFLAAQFTRAYTSKLTLLRDAATLPTGI